MKSSTAQAKTLRTVTWRLVRFQCGSDGDPTVVEVWFEGCAVKEHRDWGRERCFVQERVRCELTLVAKAWFVCGTTMPGFEAWKWNRRALCISVCETQRAIQSWRTAQALNLTEETQSWAWVSVHHGPRKGGNINYFPHLINYFLHLSNF